MVQSKHLEKVKFKRWELRKAILEIIILGLISGGGSPMRPILPLMIETIIKLLKEDKKLSVEEKKIKRVLENLEKKEIITLEERGEDVYVQSVDRDNPTIVKGLV